MKQNIFFFRDAALRAYQGVMTLPRFCGDRKHKSDGIRVAKAEPLSASFSTTSARKRDSFASILIWPIWPADDFYNVSNDASRFSQGLSSATLPL